MINLLGTWNVLQIRATILLCLNTLSVLYEIVFICLPALVQNVKVLRKMKESDHLIVPQLLIPILFRESRDTNVHIVLHCRNNDIL